MDCTNTGLSWKFYSILLLAGVFEFCLDFTCAPVIYTGAAVYFAQGTRAQWQFHAGFIERALIILRIFVTFWGAYSNFGLYFGKFGREGNAPR